MRTPETGTPEEREAGAAFARGQAAEARGDWKAALEAYERASSLIPGRAEYLYAAADLLIEAPPDDEATDPLERALKLARKGAKVAAAAGDDELGYAFEVLQGEALTRLGDARGALAILDDALKRSPRGWEARLERASALLELCRFAEAEAAFLALAKEAPQEAWPAHALGLLAERRGDGVEAARQLERASLLDPERYPVPTTLSDSDFDAVVEDAIARLPKEARDALDHATVSVDPIPEEEDLLSSDPPFSPTLLGLFRGTPFPERGTSSDPLPPSIHLYQRNLERAVRSREELVEQIQITLQHEVGHLLGLDEDDLFERGLD